MSKLVIVRGLPGSGKSTYGFKRGFVCLEGDMLRFDGDGVYQYKPEENYAIYNKIFGLVDTLLYAGHCVTVCNTHTRMQQMDTFIKIGEVYKADIEIVEMTENYGSIHDIPDAHMVKMAAEWEPVKDEWKKYVKENK